ncbi:FapA family protein [Paenibacillus monticola]|uniref:DUF342 domain-containing protein n=1 Tax=Paenibacillus monticola TaxID=2666075 RepID=A0A7X2H1F9_9BACL|nr:FapA family protein [Paenibacillus monticola]MRN51643.1 DUF342 domain-containing protein [Paenibacillus monticola]
MGIVSIQGNNIKIASNQSYSIDPPFKDFVISVNDVTLKERMRVSSKDNLIWTYIGEQISGYTLSLRAQDMELYILIHHKFELEAAPTVRLQNDNIFVGIAYKPDLKRRLTLEGLMGQIEEMDVVPQFVNQNVLKQELELPTGKEILIGKGVASLKGSDAWIETFFSDETFHRGVNENNGVVDFTSEMVIPTVDKGTKIALYHASEPGEPGTDLKGNPILAEPVKDILIPFDPSVEYRTNVWYAMIPGRPLLVANKNSYLLRIIAVYEHHGDATYEKGNIYFTGDITIHGDVHDGVQIEALGKVMVKGNVFKSSILAAGSISVTGTILNATLSAGKPSMLASMFYKELFQLNKSFEILIAAMKKFSEMANNKGYEYGTLLNILIQVKHKKFFEEVTEFVQKLDKVKSGLPEYIQILKIRLSGFMNEERIALQKDEGQMKGISIYLQTAVERVEALSTQPCDIRFASASYSEIGTGGKVEVTGKGTIHCKIHTEKGIAYLIPSGKSHGDEIHIKGALYEA